MFVDDHVSVPLDSVSLEGRLQLPGPDSPVILFAHGSGSGRDSPRNRHVAEVLQRAGFGTMLVDLLTPEEAQADLASAQLRFDIPMLAGRLAAIVDWLADQPATANKPVGLFGSSTGAAAALIAASERPAAVRAVVSRGGRADLASEALSSMSAPSLLIVGALDQQVLELNRKAAEQLQGNTRLEVVPGAGHLFEEEGALDRVGVLARDWFVRHLGPGSATLPAS